MHLSHIKHIALLVCCALFPCTALAEGFLKVNIKQSGTLAKVVNKRKLPHKQGLRIAGTLNNADVACLRQLCGRDALGNPTQALVHQLDLSQVTFMPGGAPFLTKDGVHYAISSAHAIPARLFESCPLDSVILPLHTDSIGALAFAGTQLRTVKLPDHVVLAQDAYKQILTLRTVHTGSCCNLSTDVLNRAFAYCNNLACVEADDVDRVPSYTFSGWPSLRTVRFNGLTAFVGSNAFNSCPELKDIHFNGITLVLEGPTPAINCAKLDSISISGLCLSAQYAMPEGCPQFKHYTNNALIVSTSSSNSSLTCADSTQRAAYQHWPEAYTRIMQWGKRMLRGNNPVTTGQASSIISAMHEIAEMHNLQQFKAPTDSLAQALVGRQTAIYHQELCEAGGYDHAEVSLPPIAYDQPTDSLLQRTRRMLNVDSIAGQGNDISRMQRIMTWLHDHVRHDGNSEWPKCAYNAPDLYALAQREGRGYNCRFMAIMLCEMYQSVGIPARYLVCVPKDYTEDSDCHVICVAWSDSLQKWVWMDPTWDAYVMDENGLLLNPGEVRERLVKGSPLFINDYANWNHENKTNVDEYLRQYMCKNLYYINTPLHFGANNEGKACRWQPQYITLKGVNAPGYSGYNTTNADYFWQSPR